MSVSVQGPTLQERAGQYGFDAPLVPIALALGGLVLLVLAVIDAVGQAAPITVGVFLIGGLWLVSSAASYVYTTRSGKFAVWRELLLAMTLHGDEHVLDMGCGRGAVLLMAAKLVPRGRAVGIDLWKTGDQSGNGMAAARQNAKREGVAESVDLHTGDMRELPFADGTFDLVLSSLAIHNIHVPGGRDRAVTEAVRVLKPGGRLLIVDLRATSAYAMRLRQLGMTGVAIRSLGWRFWYGGPQMAAKAVSATKPASDTSAACA